MLSVFMVIVGTVIGSGFLSGKEIVVFFSRFGWWSYICILFAGLLFFGLFCLFLFRGQKALERLGSSTLAMIINIFICIILSSAMLASVRNIVSGNIFLRLIVMSATLLTCARVVLHGQKTIATLSVMLVPIMLVALFFNLGHIAKCDFAVEFTMPTSPFISLFYAILYVVLNCANSSIVISRLGQKFTPKQKVRLALFSAVALTAILLFSNFVLLQNSDVFGSDMPLLALTGQGGMVVMSIILILGSLTTLFSLVWTISGSLTSKSKGIVYSVILPFVFSFVGFGEIVQYLYPLSSIFGLLLLGILYFLPTRSLKLKKNLQKEIF